MSKLYQFKSVTFKAFAVLAILLGTVIFSNTARAYDLPIVPPATCDASNCALGCGVWLGNNLPGVCTTPSAVCSDSSTCSCTCTTPNLQIECVSAADCGSGEICDLLGIIGLNTTPYTCVDDPNFCIPGDDSTCSGECTLLGGVCLYNPYGTCDCNVCAPGNDWMCDGWCPNYGGQCNGGGCDCYQECTPGDPSTCPTCPGGGSPNCGTDGTCSCPVNNSTCDIDPVTMQVCEQLLNQYGQGFTEDPACNGCGTWVGCPYGAQCIFDIYLPGFTCDPDSDACPAGSTVIPPGEQCDPDDPPSWQSDCTAFCGSDNVLGCEGEGTCVCISDGDPICGIQGCDIGTFPGGGDGDLPGLPDYGDVGELLGLVRDLLTPAGIIASLMLIAVCGYKVMTSQGDPRRLQEARDCVSAAITGVVFVLLSVTVLNLLIDTIIR